MPQLSIIITTWNCLGHIRKCVESLLALDLPSVETIIVDSNSKDGTREFLNELPDSPDSSKLGLRIILSDRRVKWSEANQIGLDLCGGEWICLSNPDIVFNESFLKMLNSCIGSDNLVVAPQLISPDGSPQIPKKIVTPFLFLSAYTRTGTVIWRLLRKAPPSFLAPYVWNGEETVRVDNPVGSFFMVNRKVLRALGGRLWNQGYLNGVSDLDAFLNFKRRGFPVRLFPSCRLVHFTSFITKKNPSWVEYDQSFGLVLYFRYWKMEPKLATLLLGLEGMVSVVLEIGLKMMRPRERFFNPRLRAWQSGQRILGLTDGWRFSIRKN